MGVQRRARAGLTAVIVAVLVTPGSAPASAGEDPVALLRAVEKAFIQVAKKVSPCVVSIRVGRRPTWFDKFSDEEWLKRFGRPKDEFVNPETFSVASGIIIDANGLILTNHHVIEEATRINVRLADGRPFEATLVKADPRSDLAVIKVPATGLPAATFNASGQVEVGQWVIALGSPFRFGADGHASVTRGMVSAVGRNLPWLPRPLDKHDRYYGSLIQTDASINPGNSGGPLVNIDGHVIGINTAIYSTGSGWQGIGFAIPIDAKTMAVIGKLCRGEEVVYGYLGVGITQVTEEAAERLGVPPRQGALVARVEPDGPASRAGLKEDDVITAFNGQPVSNEDELIREVGATPVGSKCTITVVRDRKVRSIEVALAKRPPGQLPETRPSQPPASTLPAEPDRRHAWRGITVQPLTRDLAERLGLAAAEGVLVATCQKDSPAYKAGIRPGFVIDHIGGQAVTSVADFQRVTRDLPAAWKGLVHTNNGFYVVGPK